MLFLFSIPFFSFGKRRGGGGVRGEVEVCTIACARIVLKFKH